MQLSEILNSKGLYRFTGPPENWLTAIKYMTWGLNAKHENDWKKIQPGDLFVLHSTKSPKFPNTKSSFIGIGVVGDNFSIKENPLWVEEFESKENIWPYLVPFSEIYLYSELPNPTKWDAPSLGSNKHIPDLIERLLSNAIPFGDIKGFPAMGSVSSIRENVALEIIGKKLPLHLHTNYQDDSVGSTYKPSDFVPMQVAEESLRYAATLKISDDIKSRTISTTSSIFERDNELLAKAEKNHSNIINQLIKKFREKGFDTLSNRFVDLLAFDGKTSCLIEVKTTENKNFRAQARKGVIQLLEYDYFEVTRFMEKQSNPSKIEKLNCLITSRLPKDKSYVDFINEYQIGVGAINNEGGYSNCGNEFGVSNILM